MARRIRCYFCDQLVQHTADCVTINSQSAREYKAGFSSGTARLPSLNSTHPMFLKGWCCALRKLHQANKNGS